MNEIPILETRDLKKYYPVTKGIIPRPVSWVKAVDGVDIKIMPKMTLGLVGESGCGKTTLGRTVLRLINPDAGKIYFQGEDITFKKQREIRPLRKEMQVIFQDPSGSLNPRFTVMDIVGEGLKVFSLYENRKDYVRKIVRNLELVGLSGDMINRYPHEFSGGQKQRIGIARALALDPKFIVCDEPVSSLDVSIQAQVINLLQEIKEKFKLSYLFISHDLSVVYHISDYVAVMYLGKIVEYAKSEDLYKNPAHPYTKALLSAVLVMDPKTGRKRLMLDSDLAGNPGAGAVGCDFFSRCKYAQEICAEISPDYNEISAGHFVRCHLI